MNINKIKQKIIAVILTLAGIIAITSCEDATAGIIIAALGICLLVTKKQVMEF